MAHRSQESWSRSVNCKRTQPGTPVPAFSLHSYLLSLISPFGIIYLCQPFVYFGGERSQRELSSSDSLRNSLYKPQAQSPKPKAQSQELPAPRTSPWMAGVQASEPPSLPLRTCLSRQLHQELERGIQHRPKDTECHHLCPTHWALCLPCTVAALETNTPYPCC